MAITRFRNSSIRNGTPKYNDVLAGLPFRPVIGTATDGGNGTSVSVAFTGNNAAGAGVTYTALSTPGSITATGPTSPIVVSGLTSGTAYTFQVKAGNSLGDSAYSAASNSVTPVTPTSFESIATATGTGSSGTITFSSIPSTYQHLQLRWIAKGTTTGTDGRQNIAVTFNSTTTNYVSHFLYGDGSAVTADVFLADTSVNLVGAGVRSGTNQTNTHGAGILDIHDYASTTKNKTVRAFFGNDCNLSNANFGVRLNSGLWINTAAITSITLTGTDNFTTSTSFALYGIKG